MSARKTPRTSAVALEDVSRAIFVLRGHRALHDEALAELYGVETKVLVQAVKRNRGGFRTISCSSSPPPSGPARRSPLRSLRLHRATRGHALLGPRQRTCHRRQHSDHACLRPHARVAGLQPTARSKTRSARGASREKARRPSSAASASPPLSRRTDSAFHLALQPRLRPVV